MGYTGGSSDSPTYEEVCADPNDSGHTEAIRVVFDPSTVTFEQLAERFFAEATPNIRRVQYRSALWAQSPEQMEIASRIATAQGKAEGVAILPKAQWHDAEGYHQKYYEKQCGASRACRRL